MGSAYISHGKEYLGGIVNLGAMLGLKNSWPLFKEAFSRVKVLIKVVVAIKI